MIERTVWNTEKMCTRCFFANTKIRANFFTVHLKTLPSSAFNRRHCEPNLSFTGCSTSGTDLVLKFAFISSLSSKTRNVTRHCELDVSRRQRRATTLQFFLFHDLIFHECLRSIIRAYVHVRVKLFASAVVDKPWNEHRIRSKLLAQRCLRWEIRGLAKKNCTEWKKEREKGTNEHEEKWKWWIIFSRLYCIKNKKQKKKITIHCACIVIKDNQHEYDSRRAVHVCCMRGDHVLFYIFVQTCRLHIVRATRPCLFVLHAGRSTFLSGSVPLIWFVWKEKRDWSQMRLLISLSSSVHEYCTHTYTRVYMCIYIHIYIIIIMPFYVSSVGI